MSGRRPLGDQQAGRDGAGVLPDVVSPAAPTSDLPVDPRVVVPRASWWSSRRTLRLATACGVGLLVLTAGVLERNGAVLWVDHHLHAAVLAHRGDVDAAVARAITWAGSTFVALPLLLVVGSVAPPPPTHLRSRLSRGLMLAGTSSLGVYAGLLLNHLVARDRPPASDWWGTAGGPAFPSGHTTVATVVAVMGAWALSERWPGAPARHRLMWAACAMAVGVGWSRVWLGVHWPSDVLGGWLAGLTWGLTALVGLGAARRWAAARPRHRRDPDRQAVPGHVV